MTANKILQINLITIFRSITLHLQIACFVQPTVKTPEKRNLRRHKREKSNKYSHTGSWSRSSFLHKWLPLIDYQNCCRLTFCWSTICSSTKQNNTGNTTIVCAKGAISLVLTSCLLLTWTANRFRFVVVVYILHQSINHSGYKTTKKRPSEFSRAWDDVLKLLTVKNPKLLNVMMT